MSTTNQQILVPDIGDYSGVEVIDIAINIGSIVNKEDTLITLETDKATMDIPAPYNLTVQELHVKKGDKVSKDSLIATVIQTEAINNSSNANQTENTNNISKQATLEFTQNINNINNINHASPSTRKFARELGVNINDSNISGSGKHGRIIDSDIKNYINNILHNNLSNSSTITAPNIDFNKWGETETQELTRIKKKSGQNLHRNWVSMPHVTHFDEADITELDQFRKQQQVIAETKGIKLTMLTFFIKALVNTLKNFPLFNSSLSNDNENLIIKKYYNIGIAVDTPKGLLVPVVKQADKKDLFTLAQELTELSQKARDGKLTSDDMQGGCFTISSLGGIGGVGFTPIINAPEVAILGISRTQNRPTYIDKQLQARLILPLALSYDHRVIDGAQAARFCKFIAEQLSNIECIKDKNYEYSN